MKAKLVSNLKRLVIGVAIMSMAIVQPMDILPQNSVLNTVVTAEAAPTNTAPGRVTLSKITASAYNKITINWQNTVNADNYIVYYKKAGISKWTRLAVVDSSNTSYTHVSSQSYPIVVGQKYIYTVRAYNSQTKEYGPYDTKGLTAHTIPSTIKLDKATLNSGKSEVTVTWNKAGGCNYYLIYRKTGSSPWKKIATVKSSILKYIDKNPVKGAKNIYTVKGYYSKTKVYGQYNRSGVSVTVPSGSLNNSAIDTVYKNVLKAIAAGKSGYGFPEVPEGASNLQYFLYDMDKDGIKELIVGTDCRVEKTYIVKLCHVYTCKKTSTGYAAKLLSGYILEPQIPSTGVGLYQNMYSRGQFLTSIYKVTIQGNQLVCGKNPVYEYHLDEEALRTFNAKNPRPEWKDISEL